MSESVRFRGGMWRNKGRIGRGPPTLGWAMGQDPRRVAVVEDEETIREGICAALRRDQHEAEGFQDGLTAWETLQHRLPDLAVLDIGLPRMDGLELCRRLARDPSACRSSS